MKTNSTHIASHIIRIFLMVFWLYVALDKLWDLPAFHRSLLRQPFPDWWADVLYWMLPLAELGIAVNFLLANPYVRAPFSVIQRSEATSESGKRSTVSAIPYALSAILLLIFSIYIGLGVAGFYAKHPCGCASVFSGLSWDWHLLANTVLLGLSILGRFLCGSPAPTDYGKEQYAHAGRSQPTLLTIAIPLYDGGFFIRRRFPRRFAPFPGRPV